MKKYILFFLFLILTLNINLYSQSTDSKSNDENNSLQKHSWAVQFQVGSNFTVQSLNNFMIDLKYHFNEKSALRFGVGLTGNSNCGDFEIYPEGIQTLTPLCKNSTHIFTSLTYMLYFNTKSLIKIYFGAGPRFGFSDDFNQSVYYDDPTTKYQDENLSWQLGLDAVFGAEWFPIKTFSLFAEYSAYGTYGKTYNSNLIVHSTGYIEIDRKFNTTDWNFNGTTARLGLSVYF